MFLNLLKSILHNIGVLCVGFIFGWLGTRLDLPFGIHEFKSLFITIAAYLLLALGFLLRAWATLLFYEQYMSVIKLAPQRKLITSGPFSFSRNPLYLGGNVFIFGGAVLFFGSPGGTVLTIINIIAVDFMIRREEKQLARDFGHEWISYKQRVRRWI